MDRNSTYVTRLPRCQVSLSARRAWIEIFGGADCSEYLKVALRKESVDRNIIYLLTASAFRVALRKESVDRNTGTLDPKKYDRVALRKESVDRNRASEITGASRFGRSPQGERG